LEKVTDLNSDSCQAKKGFGKGKGLHSEGSGRRLLLFVSAKEDSDGAAEEGYEMQGKDV